MKQQTITLVDMYEPKIEYDILLVDASKTPEEYKELILNEKEKLEKINKFTINRLIQNLHFKFEKTKEKLNNNTNIPV